MTPPKEQVRCDLICSLAEAELKQAGRGFIGFKWFRDTFLPEQGLAWAAEVAKRQSALTLAIQDGLILVDKRINPREPQFGTTAIRLNRADPRVGVLLGQTPAWGPLGTHRT
jgi:hypothetical protein